MSSQFLVEIPEIRFPNSFLAWLLPNKPPNEQAQVDKQFKIMPAGGSFFSLWHSCECNSTNSKPYKNSINLPTSSSEL